MKSEIRIGLGRTDDATLATRSTGICHDAGRDGSSRLSRLSQMAIRDGDSIIRTSYESRGWKVERHTDIGLLSAIEGATQGLYISCK